MNISSFAASAVLVAIAIGCSSDPEQPDAGSACGQLAAAERAYFSKCGESKSDAAWQQFVTRTAQLCEAQLSLAGVSIKQEHISACANVLSAAPCTTRVDDLPKCVLPNGTLADGAPCSVGEQCKSGSCGGRAPICGTCAARVPVAGDCSSNPNCVDGAICHPTTKTCKAYVFNATGGSCNPLEAERCQAGLYCETATRTCKARGAVGAACSSTAPCEVGLLCTDARTCAAPPARATEGEPCSRSAGGASCDTNLTCDSATDKCVKIAWVAPGGDCSAPFAVCDYGFCNETTKKCPALLADGQPCTHDASVGVCDRRAGCIDGTCQSPESTVCK